jgi:arylsulfatase A-like enzyme
LGTLGDPDAVTPNIDRLAAEGMKFHRFFCVAPQCVPSRAGMMTGRSAVAARMTRFSSPLPREETIFPEVLRREGGYYTGIAGRGFHLDGPEPHSLGAVSAKTRVNRELGFVTFADRVDFIDTSNPPEYAARVGAFLDGKPADQPFFLWMNFIDPHHYWNATEDEPNSAKVTIPGYLPDLPNVRRQLAGYYGEVKRVDRQVQEIIDVIAKRGLADNLLIVFVGDNGRAFPHGKGSLYDPGLNVPFIVHWPGVIKPGTESRALISGEDLAPTLLAAAGLAAPERMTGESFLSLLRGEPHIARSHIFAERGPHGNEAIWSEVKSSVLDFSRCVRNDRYKFIYNATPWVPYAPVDSTREPNSGWNDMTMANDEGTLAPEFRRAHFTTPRPIYELYDLDADPSEMNNVVGDPELAPVEEELRLALIKKMTLDFDYLPLPSDKVGEAIPWSR